MGDLDLGHRERLRNRYLNFGIKGLHDYEVLELLLMYLIPRKDCKANAKLLLQKYKTIGNVLLLDLEELVSNDGLTTRGYILFKLIKDIAEDQILKKSLENKVLISSNKKLLEYLRLNIGNNEREVFKVLYLNSQNELISDENLFIGTLDRSVIYLRELVKRIFDCNAKSIIIAHNHPSGNLNPSDSDIILTKKIKESLKNLDIKLIDHVIVSEEGYFSFLEGGIL